MAKKLNMSFATALGGKTSLSLDEPKEDLTENQVRLVMENIITNNLFSTTKGDLTEIKSAEIITTTKDVLI